MRGKSYLPDKEFRYLRHSCYSSPDMLSGKRPGHFCLTPYVAIGIGLYLYPLVAYQRTTWRAVSEDPVSGFLLIVPTRRIVTAHC